VFVLAIGMATIVLLFVDLQSSVNLQWIMRRFRCGGGIDPGSDEDGVGCQAMVLPLGVL
jgi:hypothetical protein